MRAAASRVYDLYPLLAGPIYTWREHLPRIAGMGVDWGYVNAFWTPRASGSIYPIADPLELHPLVRGESHESASDLVRGFVEAAREHGLKVMLDLVVPHVAREARLVQERPDWFRWQDGQPAAPVLANPTDPRHPRHMSDLAELELGRRELWPTQAEHFLGFIRHYLELGVAGFRCSSAYKVPPELWRWLIGAARDTHKDAVFLAAALGCSFDQVRPLAGCGFDLIFDSSCWWDFHAHWFLDQNDELRRIAPTVAFPEDHNTPRLAERFDVEGPDETARLYRARYLSALAVASGVLIPMGYEYGFRRRLDPVRTTPEDWHAQRAQAEIDLTGFLAEANAFKRDTTVLGTAGPLRRVSAPNGRVVGLLRLDAGSTLAAGSEALTLVNPDLARPDGIGLGPLLTAAGGRIAAFADQTPGVPPLPFVAGTTLTLDPLGVRLFVGHADATEGRAPTPEVTQKRLEDLAANRVAVERVTPELDGGRFPIKRIVGDVLEVEADIFCDGHEKLAAVVKYRQRDDEAWQEAPMRLVDNDRWAGRFPLTRNTRYLYTVEAWRDLYASWRVEVTKKHDADVPITLELIEGRRLIEKAAEHAKGEDATRLGDLAARLSEREDDQSFLLATMLGEETRALMGRAAPRA